MQSASYMEFIMNEIAYWFFMLEFPIQLFFDFYS